MSRLLLSLSLASLLYQTPLYTMELDNPLAHKSSNLASTILSTLAAGACFASSYYLFKLLVAKTPQEKFALLHKKFNKIQKFLKECDLYLLEERSLGLEIKKISPTNTQDIRGYEERLLTILMSHHHNYPLSYPLYFYAEEISSVVQKIEYSLVTLTTIIKKLEKFAPEQKLTTDIRLLRAQCQKSIEQCNHLYRELNFVKGIITNKPRYEKERKIEAKNSRALAYAFTHIHPRYIYLPVYC